ncbi:MAG: hypothetical protein IJF33_06705 [Clostridia bacterium]|nr:hypothetical protein [Clostridia bacterium]
MNTPSTLLKQPYCQYGTDFDFACATEGLRIYLPTQNGYICYCLVHSVKESIYADLWRIGRAYVCDDDLKNASPITTPSAEWDMAVRLEGRDDAIGGYAHGDETYTTMTLFVDGKEIVPSKLLEPTPFTELRMAQDSVGYDPNDHITQALLHHKETLVNANGITLHQHVKFLNAYSVNRAYLAMMPPMKAYTDHYSTDLTPTSEISSVDGKLNIRVPNAKRAVVSGEHLQFEMSVPRYPSLPGGDYFLLTDNGGAPYNKMYFCLCHGAQSAKGDVWATTTTYAIENS